MQTIDDNDNYAGDLKRIMEVQTSELVLDAEVEAFQRKTVRSKVRRQCIHRKHFKEFAFTEDKCKQSGALPFDQKGSNHLLFPSQSANGSRNNTKVSQSSMQVQSASISQPQNTSAPLGNHSQVCANSSTTCDIQTQESCEDTYAEIRNDGIPGEIGPAQDQLNHRRNIPSHGRPKLNGPQYEAKAKNKREIRQRGRRLFSMRQFIRQEIAAPNIHQDEVDQQQEQLQPSINNISNAVDTRRNRIVSQSFNYINSNFNDNSNSERQDRSYFRGFNNSILNDNTGDEFTGFIPTLTRVLLFLFQMYLLLSISALTYYAAYLVYAMPRCYVNRPLYFDYASSDKLDDRFQNLKSRYVERDSDGMNIRNVNKDLIGNSMTATASIDFTTYKDVAWDSHLTNTLSGPVLRRILDPHHYYYIEILLDLPDTYTNRNGGMFGMRIELFTISSTESIKPHKEMIIEKTNISSSSLYYTIDGDAKCQITSADGLHHNHKHEYSSREPHPNTRLKSMTSSFDLLATSRRSARYPYVSTWIDRIQKVLFILPLLLHITDESRTVRIFAFRHYMESFRYPLNHAIVSIHDVNYRGNRYRRQSHSNADIGLHMCYPEIVRGKIVIGTEFSAFQELLRHYFVTSFCVGTSIIAAIYYCFIYFILRYMRYYEQVYWNNSDQQEQRQRQPSSNVDFDEYGEYNSIGDDGDFLDDPSADLNLNDNDNLNWFDEYGVHEVDEDITDWSSSYATAAREESSKCSSSSPSYINNVSVQSEDFE